MYTCTVLLTYLRIDKSVPSIDSLRRGTPAQSLVHYCLLECVQDGEVETDRQEVRIEEK